MPFSHHDQVQIDRFFSEIEPLLPAYRFPSFRFIAVRCDAEWVLFHGVLALHATHSPLEPLFLTESLLAGEVGISEIAGSPLDFLRLIVGPGISAGNRQLIFPPESSGHHRAFHRVFDGAANPHERAASLTVSGSNNYYRFVQEQTITRELKTASVPFDSIAELASHFRMNFEPSMNLHVDIHASGVCEVTDDSYLKVGMASVAVRLASQLQTDKVRVSLRGRLRDGSNTRLADLGFDWKQADGGEWISNSSFPFPEGKSLTCTLSYAGLVQQECAIEEPVEFHNTVRFALNLFGDADAAFARVLNDPKATNRDGREFEATVNAILSLAGFQTAAVDRIPDLGEMPDILASDPIGNLLVVECTLKLPNATDKFDKLFNRAEAIRLALHRVGLTQLRVLAVLATVIPQDKIVAYMEDARKAGILLWGREQVQALQQQAKTQTATEIFDAIAAQDEMMALYAAYDDRSEEP